jgi:hypothetical protein
MTFAKREPHANCSVTSEIQRVFVFRHQFSFIAQRTSSACIDEGFTDGFGMFRKFIDGRLSTPQHRFRDELKVALIPPLEACPQAFFQVLFL